MKCRWRKDSDALIRRNGVVAEAGRDSREERTVRRGSCVGVCVWVSTVSPASSSSSLWHGTKGRNVKNQLESWPVLPAAVTAAGAGEPGAGE